MLIINTDSAIEFALHILKAHHYDSEIWREAISAYLSYAAECDGNFEIVNLVEDFILNYANFNKWNELQITEHQFLSNPRILNGVVWSWDSDYVIWTSN